MTKKTAMSAWARQSARLPETPYSLRQHIMLGIILWGIGLGTQESIMRAFVAQIIPVNKRATAFGIFNACFGLSWFLGSALMGLLYGTSFLSLVIFSSSLQLVSATLISVKMRK